jgi:hypothetical protein
MQMIRQQTKHRHIERTFRLNLAKGLFQYRTGNLFGQKRLTPIRQDRKEIPCRIDFYSPIIRHDPNYIQLSKEHKMIKIPRGQSPPYKKFAQPTRLTPSILAFAE